MLIAVGSTHYADIWYSEGGYIVSLIPAGKMMPNPGGFFPLTYNEQDVALQLGPYPDEATAEREARSAVKERRG